MDESPIFPTRGPIRDLAEAELRVGKRFGELRKIRILLGDHWWRTIGGFGRTMPFGRECLLAIIEPDYVRRVRAGEDVPWDNDE